VKEELKNSPRMDRWNIRRYTCRGGVGNGGVHFFVPTESRPGSISPLAESRPTSPIATIVRALSPLTRLPMVVAAEVHRLMGGGGF